MDHNDEHALPQPDPKRRSFLKVAPFGALVAVAAAAQQPAAAAPAPAVVPAEPVQGGYHETEHIRTYYRTAAIW
jgi:hypothetical protein